MYKIDFNDINEFNNYKYKILPYSLVLTSISSYLFYKISNFINQLGINHLKSNDISLNNINIRKPFFIKFKYYIIGVNFLLSFIILQSNYYIKSESLYIKYKDLVDDYSLNKINKEKFDNFGLEIINN